MTEGTNNFHFRVFANDLIIHVSLITSPRNEKGERYDIRVNILKDTKRRSRPLQACKYRYGPRTNLMFCINYAEISSSRLWSERTDLVFGEIGDY